MENTPKLVLMTPTELDNLIQSSVRKAIIEQSSKLSFPDDKPLTIDEASKFLKILSNVSTFDASSKLNRVSVFKRLQVKILSKFKQIEWAKIRDKLLSFLGELLLEKIGDILINHIDYLGYYHQIVNQIEDVYLILTDIIKLV
jgi:hypothetical protein